MVKSKSARRQQEQTARAKVAALRVDQRQAQRRQLVIVVGAVAAVLAVVAAIVGVYLAGGGVPEQRAGGGKIAQQAGGGGVPSAALTAATTVPAETLDAVGRGSAQLLPKPVNAEPTTTTGKPKVFYIGAEFCPYCAAERWPMVVALSRFGSFENLGVTHSAADDVFANTPTFTFHGARYSSRYLSFVGKELSTNERSGNGYAPLDKLTAAEQNRFSQLTGGQNSFPTVDFAGRYLLSGAQYDPTVLQGRSMGQIASALKSPNDPVAMAVDGSANTITAALCKLTEGQPRTVCGSTTIKRLQGQLDAGE